MREASLGQYLRSQREKKGLTIEQVASATKISVRLLHAIENDQYVDLPAKPFIRGFVIAYSRFVGFSGKETLTHYGAYIDDKASERPALEGSHSGYAFEKKSTEQSRTILWIMMVGFVVLAGIGMLVLNPRFKHRNLKELRAAHSRTVLPDGKNKEAVSAKESSTPVLEPGAVTIAVSAEDSKAGEVLIAKPEPKKEEAPQPQVQPSVLPSGLKLISKDKRADPYRIPEANDPQNKGDTYKASEIAVKVVMKTERDVWIRYQVDQKPVTKFILTKGKWIVFRANDILRFQVTDPAALQVRYQSSDFKNLGSYQDRFARHNETPTLVFPFEKSSQGDSPFPNEGPLPALDARG